MPIKRYKPITAGRRISSVEDFSDITKHTPEKSLIISKKQMAGRNAQGKITVRHQGGGAKRHIRVIDFLRDKYNVPAKVAAIEYDPNRGARLALLHYVDGEKRYMIGLEKLNVGDVVVSSLEKGEFKVGNRFPLEMLPVGVEICDIELEPRRGGKMAHGAGAVAQLMAVEGQYATLKMPSGEIRMVPKSCSATIGRVSNSDYRLIRWGKAGRMRHRSIRPSVRGKAMNPVDHPHGGGEGNSPIGLKHPKTPSGKPALGVLTRRRRASDRLIITRRKRRIE